MEDHQRRGRSLGASYLFRSSKLEPVVQTTTHNGASNMIEKASSVSGWRTILLIGGSLRANSVNAAVLKTVQTLIPTNAKAAIYTGLADLPHFNPDDDRDPLPEPVARLRDQLRTADAVLFSTPEYAGTLPGSFKNLLDWTVGGGSLYRLPVGWVNPSAHGGSQGPTRFCARFSTWREPKSWSRHA
jgi:hypothetical protein